MECARYAGRSRDGRNVALREVLPLHGDLAEDYVGMSAVYGKRRMFDDGLRMLARAESIDPGLVER